MIWYAGILKHVRMCATFWISEMTERILTATAVLAALLTQSVKHPLRIGSNGIEHRKAIIYSSRFQQEPYHNSVLPKSQQDVRCGTRLWKQRAEVMLGRRKAIMQVAARWQGSDAASWLNGFVRICEDE